MTAVLKPVDDDFELANHLRGLFTRARAVRRDYHENWYRNYRLVHNRQATQTTNTWVPRPRDSEIYPCLATIVSWMADQNTIIEYGPAANPNSEYYEFLQQLADDLTSVVQTNWHTLDYTAQMKLMLWDGLVYGAGFSKTVWDQAIDKGNGNALFKRVDPWALYIDPNATSLDDAEYIIEARQMTFDEVERRWPNAAQGLRDAGGGVSDIDERPNRQSAPSPAIHNLGNLSSTAGTTRWASPKASRAMSLTDRQNLVVYEFWVRENEDWEDATDDPTSETHIEAKWRVVVMAANTILMDEYADDLWPGGGHPYDRWVYDDIGELYGISLVDHLASPQIYINRLLTAIQQNAELCGNPIFMQPKNSGTDRTPIINRPGNVLNLNPQSMQTPPTWLTPPPISSDVRPLIDFYIDRIENISGMRAIVKGSVQTGAMRTSEGTNSAIQEAAFVRIRNGLQNLEATIASIGSKIANLIIDNYTDPRYIAVVGPTGIQTSKFFAANHFKLGKQPLEYAIRVDAGAAASTSRTTRMAQAREGLAMGAIDGRAWLEMVNFPGWKEVDKRVTDMKAVGAFQPPGARQRAGRTS